MILNFEASRHNFQIRTASPQFSGYLTVEHNDKKLRSRQASDLVHNPSDPMAKSKISLPDLYHIRAVFESDDWGFNAGSMHPILTCIDEETLLKYRYLNRDCGYEILCLEKPV